MNGSRPTSLAGTDDRVSDQPAGSFPNRGSAGALQRLDAIMRTGESLARAIDACTREQVCALADRLGMNSNGSTLVLRIQVKRRLLGASGLLRESRAK